jgi:hypothetical protein
MIGEGVAVSDPILHQSQTHTRETKTLADDAIKQIHESLRGLRFGSVNIIVQDGVIIQIDRTEKRRLRNGKANR